MWYAVVVVVTVDIYHPFARYVEEIEDVRRNSTVSDQITSRGVRQARSLPRVAFVLRPTFLEHTHTQQYPSNLKLSSSSFMKIINFLLPSECFMNQGLLVDLLVFGTAWHFFYATFSGSLSTRSSYVDACGESSMVCLHSNQYLKLHAWPQHTRTGF